jgi:ParB family transcriptional regulator, chromosome partitioning protein
MQLPEGKSRLDLVREGVLSQTTLPKRGRFVVSIHKLLEDPKNERRTFRNMEGLIASIKAHGIVEPITVTSEGENYRILTGHRRFRAAKAAGVAEVEVIAREPEHELIRRRKSIVSNVQREDIGPVEMAEALQSLLDEDTTVHSQRDLAALIGKRETWVSDMLSILNLPARQQEKLRTSEVSVSYDSVMRISRIKDPEDQKGLIEAVLAGESVREIRQRIDDIRAMNPASAGKRAVKKSSPSTLAHTTFTESYEGCIATVRGPVGEETRDNMREALKRLLKQF